MMMKTDGHSVVQFQFVQYLIQGFTEYGFYVFFRRVHPVLFMCKGSRKRVIQPFPAKRIFHFFSPEIESTAALLFYQSPRTGGFC